jgi:hypothetical protein
MEYSSARNHLTSLIELIPAVVALDTHKTYTINAPLIAGKSCPDLHVRTYINALGMEVIDSNNVLAMNFMCVTRLVHLNTPADMHSSPCKQPGPRAQLIATQPAQHPCVVWGVRSDPTPVLPVVHVPCLNLS